MGGVAGVTDAVSNAAEAATFAGTPRRLPVVVKLGGRTQSDPLLPAALAALWTSTDGNLVIVHGGGDSISALQRMRGEEPVFVGGRRVTTPAALELVRMVLSGAANKTLVSALTSAGAPAVGISGEDGATLLAVPIDLETFGLSGTPTGVNTRLIDTLLAAGFLPVVSPVAKSGNTLSDGVDAGALNVNGDDAAAAIAGAMRAAELFLLADVPGVLDEDKRTIPTLTDGAAQFLVTSGIAAGGMAAKLEAAARALEGGVGRVRIGDLAALGVADAGTRITSTLAGRT